MSKKLKEGKILIIVDMQNDFITGALANPDAQKIVQPLCDYIGKFDGRHICCTRDTHQDNYLLTAEGKNLPIKHCIEGTPGWCLEENIRQAIVNARYEPFYVNKRTFGFKDWDMLSMITKANEIIMVGTCTDICVISNALILKALVPEAKITVLKDLCAGLTKEKHEAALEVMRSCQIEVK